MSEPTPIGSGDLDPRFARILAERGISPVSEDDIEGYSPDEPGHPAFHQRQRAAAGLARWATATPPRYQRATVSDERILSWVADVIADPDGANSILITGTTGTGKTHQAYGALRLVAEAGLRNFQMMATNSADMYGALRPTGAAGASEHWLRKLCEIPLLLLDDLGSAKASEWTEEVTYRLINHRYNHCLPTIFTSNLPPRGENGAADLGSALGERIVSRLAEMTTVVAMVGTDRRRSA
jgi:DNA replication protein DnaC